MERPILFSAEMVRAILAGWKTQTRRVITNWILEGETTADGITTGGYEPGRCPYGVPGDRLWVKSRWLITDLFLSPEEWSEEAAGDLWCYKGKAKPEHAPHVRYAAELRNPERFHGAFRSGLHMPRWASRITLEVTSVRVERLQDITEEDAWAEGIEELDGALDERALCLRAKAMGEPVESARVTFAELWDSINGKRPGCSWADNPWVWTIHFRMEVQDRCRTKCW